MPICKVCKRDLFLSAALGVCADCIKNSWEQARPIVAEVHKASRQRFGLPPEIPTEDRLCGMCANNCKIPEGQKGYCGLKENRGGKIIHLAGMPDKGLLRFYYDPIPTNCVGAWACAATGAGYPKYSYSKGLESGYVNLSVFYGACSFNCLFCQNWQFKYMTQALEPLYSAQELANGVTSETSCVCFFGGDPSPQLPHALASAKAAQGKNKILRFCLETNGKENPALLKEFAALSLESGGNIKFDLKFFNENLALALSGVPNKQVFKNFEALGELNAQRKQPPFLFASTLLVPGYVDKEEVRQIAQFIASIDKDIPYSLLAFYPCFVMDDLPCTSRKLASECLEAAKAAGLTRVRIGNEHLLV